MKETPARKFEKEIPNRFTYNSDLGLSLVHENIVKKPTCKVISINSTQIHSEEVRAFVRDQIDFPLTDKQWSVIDVAMGKYWNNRVPGTWICNEDIAAFIFWYCENEKLLISWERILKITNQIWQYLEMKGRLVDK